MFHVLLASGLPASLGTAAVVARAMRVAEDVVRAMSRLLAAVAEHTLLRPRPRRWRAGGLRRA